MPKPTLVLTPRSCVYEISGPALRTVLTDLGKTQSDLTRACGYASEGRVCRIVKSRAFRLSSAAAQKIVEAVRSLGGEVEGLVPGIDAPAAAEARS